jgi:hypothetical protein
MQVTRDVLEEAHNAIEEFVVLKGEHDLCHIDWRSKTTPGGLRMFVVAGDQGLLCFCEQNRNTQSRLARLASAHHLVWQAWIEPQGGSRIWLGVMVDHVYKRYPCTPADFGL